MTLVELCVGVETSKNRIYTLFCHFLVVGNFISRRKTGNYYIFLLRWDKKAGKLIILRHIIKFHNLGASRQCKNNWKELNPFSPQGLRWSIKLLHVYSLVCYIYCRAMDWADSKKKGFNVEVEDLILVGLKMFAHRHDRHTKWKCFHF